MRQRKSFREKLANDHGLPRIEAITQKIAARWGVEGTMVIPAPREVDAIMRRVPRGRLITIDEIRAALAARHGTTVACPITTGIFASIAARAGEDEAEGRKRVTPYWRTLKGSGELNPKYPGGLAEQKRRLRAEGDEVVAKGNRAFVADYERWLAKV
jgi:6-O-methylguanine DNA methyltransferase, DNA binding domain